MRARFVLLLLALAALPALVVLSPGGPAEAARRKKEKPITYPHQEWRQTRDGNGALQTEWEVLLSAADAEPVRNGVFRRYHPNGRLAFLGAYRNGDPVGVWTWLDDRGNLVRQTRQRADYDDEIAGAEARSPISIFRNPAGRATAEGQLKGDAPHGHWLFYHPNGTPRAEGDFVTGVADGLWNYYYANGQLERQMRFVLGVPEGPYRSGFDNGQERERGAYQQGLRTGPWRTWDVTGQLRQEGDYREDRKVGEWRAWDAAGRLVQREQFQDGALLASLPVPPPPQPKPRVIPDENALPIPPHLYTEDGEKVPLYDEDKLQAPPPPPRGKRAPKSPPLSTWQNADQAGK